MVGAPLIVQQVGRGLWSPRKIVKIPKLDPHSALNFCDQRRPTLASLRCIAFVRPSRIACLLPLLSGHCLTYELP